MCIYSTSQAVETESHFLLECSLFVKERMDFLEKVNIYLPVNNNYATNEHKFVAIMFSDEKSVYISMSEQKKYMYCNNHKIKSEHINNHAS